MTTTLAAPVMIIERVDTETGDVTSSDRSTTHGWATASDAVAYWKANSSRFEPYRNGRVVTNGDGHAIRAYFEEA